MGILCGFYTATSDGNKGHFTLVEFGGHWLACNIQIMWLVEKPETVHVHLTLDLASPKGQPKFWHGWKFYMVFYTATSDGNKGHFTLVEFGGPWLACNIHFMWLVEKPEMVHVHLTLDLASPKGQPSFWNGWKFYMAFYTTTSDGNKGHFTLVEFEGPLIGL